MLRKLLILQDKNDQCRLGSPREQPLERKLFALRDFYTYIGIRKFDSARKTSRLGRGLKKEFDGVS